MQLRIPRVGVFLAFLRTPFGMAALAAALTTVLIALGASGTSRAETGGHPLRVEDDF